MKVTESKLTEFMDVYEKELRKSILETPHHRTYRINGVGPVLSKIRISVRDGFFFKDTPAFKRTCEVLGIPHTYKGIGAFIERIEGRRILL